MNGTNDRIGGHIDKIVADLHLADELPVPDRPSPGSRRRRRFYDPKQFNGLATLSLVEEDGILQFVYQPPVRGPAGRRRRRAAMHAVGAEPIREFSFKETPPNQVIAAIEDLDRKLTPNQGLRRYQQGGNGAKGTFQALAPGFAANGRVLLLVHGTFSKSDMYIDEFGAINAGPEVGFLERAAKEYEAILAFDHPTLSVSPWINALDLEDALQKVSGPIDVICHSRGGLVVAWWLRNAKRRVENVTFVGSPLDGTSLASPANLRSALQGLASMFKAVEATSSIATFFPLMSVVTGLAKICGGILQLGASTPLADATIAIIPGLASQARVGNSAELRCLHRSKWISEPEFHAVVSNFQPGETDAHWWEVWKRFSNPKLKALDWGADAIFQRANDLVVDTDAMAKIYGGSIKNVCDFKTSSTVHHINYFRQPETVAYLRDKLRIP